MILHDSLEKPDLGKTQGMPFSVESWFENTDFLEIPGEMEQNTKC